MAFYGLGENRVQSRKLADNYSRFVSKVETYFLCICISLLDADTESLVIKNCSIEDMGTYRCLVQHKASGKKKWSENRAKVNLNEISECNTIYYKTHYIIAYIIHRNLIEKLLFLSGSHLELF